MFMAPNGLCAGPGGTRRRDARQQQYNDFPPPGPPRRRRRGGSPRRVPSILPTAARRAFQILRTSPECRPETASTYVERVNRSIDHVVSHLAAPLRLRDLSRAARLSPFHFHRVFQALVGSTPAEFVKRLRLEKALGLMARPRAPSLTAVALACGFSSSSDFSRCFKQRFGVPPSAFDVGAWRR